MGNPLTLQVGKKCSYYKMIDRKKWNYALVDVAHVISQEMCAITVSGHPLGTKVSTNLAYMGFIMGLCRKLSVKIPSVLHKEIKIVVNDAYVGRHCMPRLEGDRGLKPEAVDPLDDPIRYNKQLDYRYNWEMMEAQ
ncbi:hypothetical protein RYX36_010858 [Vicia faba]